MLRQRYTRVLVPLYVWLYGDYRERRGDHGEWRYATDCMNGRNSVGGPLLGDRGLPGNIQMSNDWNY
jgi:hypothetical protein